ncbi:MAG: Uroporphyrinogen-III C-methyltransferase [Methanoregula sp. PtaU1.Bin051]|nr:MAG: Uroporphyrinogen-III C-methyltransferase [Methanoregula sp. PtaU1.Bin051]
MPSHAEQGWLAIVGIGPGNRQQMTARALKVIAGADIVIGNDTYLDQLESLLTRKEIIRSTMGKEVERAKAAIEYATERRVAIVSGGDAGVYGMAGIVLEVLEHTGIDLHIEIVPGVTAANAAASRVGSPLSGDFAVISLSDLLTPLKVIEKRLSAIFSAGIPVVLYNPKSRGRPHNFARAVTIARKYMPDTVPVAMIKNAYRDGEEICITTLGEAEKHEDFVDMHTTVIIGGEESRIWRMGTDVKGIITPRGYHRKYVY